MIIQNRWFILQAPIRADLSGCPFGFLFVWLGGVPTPPTRKRYEPHRYEPHPGARQFGFCLPSPIHALRRLYPKYELLECVQFKDGDAYIPHDWRKWPEAYRLACEAAVQCALDERPGAKIISDRSFCARRADLSGSPLQLYRMIDLKAA